MSFDAGSVLGLVLLGGFFLAILWAEVVSRRNRRRSQTGVEGGGKTFNPPGQPVGQPMTQPRDRTSGKRGRRREFER